MGDVPVIHVGSEDERRPDGLLCLVDRSAATSGEAEPDVVATRNGATDQGAMSGVIVLKIG